jgi:hypothetical protein
MKNYLEQKEKSGKINVQKRNIKFEEKNLAFQTPQLQNE